MCLVLFKIFTVISQPGVGWQKSLGGSNLDAAISVKQTSDNGYTVAGYATSSKGNN